MQFPCYNYSFYCPEGIDKPISVNIGYYSLPNTDLTALSESTEILRISEEICPVGYFCSDGLKYPCPAGTYGNASGMRLDLIVNIKILILFNIIIYQD